MVGYIAPIALFIIIALGTPFGLVKPTEVTNLVPTIQKIEVPQYNNQDIMCLAKNIYFEARNQSRFGQIAVAMVTMNRLYNTNYPDKICDVVYQRNERGCQFSWTCLYKDAQPRDRLAWEESIDVALHILENYDKINDPTDGALFYHAQYVKPKWSKIFAKTAVIDDHIFYRSK